MESNLIGRHENRNIDQQFLKKNCVRNISTEDLIAVDDVEDFIRSHLPIVRETNDARDRFCSSSSTDRFLDHRFVETENPDGDLKRVDRTNDSPSRTGTVLPRTRRFVTEGAKLSTILRNRLETNRITALQWRSVSFVLRLSSDAFTNVEMSTLLSTLVRDDCAHDNSP